MKNHLFLFFAAALFLSSCGKDNLSESIVGTWDLESLNVACPADITDIDSGDFPAINGCLSGGDFEVGCIRLIFTEDGMYESFSSEIGEELSSDSDEVPYTVNDDNDTVSVCDDDGEDCLIFTYKDDVLTIAIPEDGCTLTYSFKK